MKKLLRDPSLWILLASNVFILVHYIEVPGSIHTVILLFWIQSVLIGIFNALDIMTATHIVDNSYAIKGPFNVRINAGLFFLLHYGVFHAVYLLFIFTLVIRAHEVDWNFVITCSWFLAITSGIGFVQNKIRNRKMAAHIGNMFMMPYLRIIPMHMVILIPAFLHISAPIVFFIFKIMADMATHILYQRSIYKPIGYVDNP